MIPARGALTALETGVHDSGYIVSATGRILHGAAYTSAGNPPHGFPPPSEPHRRLIRTGLAARVAHLIGVGDMATATGGIGVEPVIRGGDNWRAISIDVDIARCRPRPGEVHCVASMHFVAARS
jgi:hypothetical protein